MNPLVSFCRLILKAYEDLVGGPGSLDLSFLIQKNAS